MSSGEIDRSPEYVAARRVLLDALEALRPHEAAVVLVGAQAVYLRTDRIDADRSDRLEDKDASDIVRLMQSEAPAVVGSTLHGLLEDTIAGESTGFAVERFRALFGNRAGLGIKMAARALRRAMPEERVRAICLAYTEALYEELALDGSPPVRGLHDASPR